MSLPYENDKTSAKSTATLLAICAVALNVGFFFLSSRYYADKVASYGPAGYGDAELTHTRITFLIFTLVTTAVGAAGAFQSWRTGFILSFLAGAAALVAGGGAIAGHLHPILAATLFVVGAIFLLLAYYAMAWRSRAAWSFLVGLNWMAVATTLFGATKIRNALGTGLWTALIVPACFAVAAVALIAVRKAFEDDEAGAPKNRGAGISERSFLLMMGGIALLVIGVGFSVFSYQTASAGGGSYFVAVGPVVTGAGMLFRGLIRRR